MRLDLGRLPDDGQRHLRHGAGGGDAAIGLAVGVVLAAVLDLKVQPRAPAFAAHLAAVGFAGQVHPGAGAVLEPVAVGAERLVYVQAEALGAAAFGHRYLECGQTERHLHALGQGGRGIAAHQFGDARVAVGDQFAVPAAGHQGQVTGRSDGDLLAVFDAIAVAVASQAGRAVGAQQAGGLVLPVVGQTVAVGVRRTRIRRLRRGRSRGEVGHRLGREAGRVFSGGGFLHRLRVGAGARGGLGDAHLLALAHRALQRQRDGLGRCIHDHAGDAVAHAIDQHHEGIVGRVMGLVRVQPGFIAVLQYQLLAVHRGGVDDKDLGVDDDGGDIARFGAGAVVADAVRYAVQSHFDPVNAGTRQVGRGCEGGGPDSAVGAGDRPQVAHRTVGDLNGSFGEATDALVEGDGDGGGVAGGEVRFVDRNAGDPGILGVDHVVVAGGADRCGVVYGVTDGIEVAQADGVGVILEVRACRVGDGVGAAVG